MARDERPRSISLKCSVDDGFRIHEHMFPGQEAESPASTRRMSSPARVDKLAKSALLKSAARKGTVGSSPTPGIVGDIAIRLQPRARRDEVVGERGGAVVVRVSAPPVDGRANEALCRFVAKAAGVAPSRVTIVRGLGSRDKVVRVDGVDEAALRDALGV